MSALLELWDGFRDWRRWAWLGYYDIKLSNRRSMIGAWWPTISLAIFSFGIGHLWAALINRPVEVYLPHVVLGWLAWQMIQTSVNQASSMFIVGGAVLKESLLPPNTMILRRLTMHTVQTYQGLLVVAAAFIYVGLPVSPTMLFFPVAIAINLFVLHGAMLFLGGIGARLKDLGPLVESGMRLAFFLTPIIWMPERVDEGRLSFIDYNPFYYMIEIVRMPMKDGVIPWSFVGIVLALGVISNLAGLLTFALVRRRLIYWV